MWVGTLVVSEVLVGTLVVSEVWVGTLVVRCWFIIFIFQAERSFCV